MVDARWPSCSPTRCGDNPRPAPGRRRAAAPRRGRPVRAAAQPWSAASRRSRCAGRPAATGCTSSTWRTTTGTPVYVHAKVCVVDDVWASVGSDNFNRRSWTHDSELSCAVLDETARRAGRRADPAGLGDGARGFARDLRLRAAARAPGPRPTTTRPGRPGRRPYAAVERDRRRAATTGTAAAGAGPARPAGCGRTSRSGCRWHRGCGRSRRTGWSTTRTGGRGGTAAPALVSAGHASAPARLIRWRRSHWAGARSAASGRAGQRQGDPPRPASAARPAAPSGSPRRRRPARTGAASSPPASTAPSGQDRRAAGAVLVEQHQAAWSKPGRAA